jgi:hypothetical protein
MHILLLIIVSFLFFKFAFPVASSCASKETMIARMKKGHTLALIPGGLQEATIHSDEEERLFIQSRKGFIKYLYETYHQSLSLHAHVN